MMYTALTRRDAIAEEIMHELASRHFVHPCSSIRTCRMDLADVGDHYELKADLPGYAREDLHIDLNGDQLTISGSCEQNDENDARDYIFRERRHESFSRSFDLEGLDRDAITAQFHNGVLTVFLPKKPEEIESKRSIAID